MNRQHLISAARGLTWAGVATIVISLIMFMFFTRLMSMDNQSHDISRLQFLWGFCGVFGGLFFGIVTGVAIEHKLINPRKKQ